MTIQEASDYLGFPKRKIQQEINKGKLQTREVITGLKGKKETYVWINTIVQRIFTDELFVILSDIKYHKINVVDVITDVEAEEKGMCKNCTLNCICHPLDRQGNKYCLIPLIKDGILEIKNGMLEMKEKK
jgi:TPP-dependent 2-oxoacid decarboxylase